MFYGPCGIVSVIISMDQAPTGPSCPFLPTLEFSRCQELAVLNPVPSLPHEFSSANVKRMLCGIENVVVNK